MSPELIAILTIGVTLAGGQLAAVLWLVARMDERFGRMDERFDQLRADVQKEIGGLRAEMQAAVQALRDEMQADMQALRDEIQAGMQALRTELKADMQQVRAEIRAVETRVASVEQGQARLEGLVDGLREAITGRATPAA